MRVVVVGATGNVGGHILHLLLHQLDLHAQHRVSDAGFRTLAALIEYTTARARDTIIATQCCSPSFFIVWL